MNYQSFISIFFLFILTINYSLTLSYFGPTNDELDQSDENDLQKISVKYDNNQHYHKWRRHSELTSTRTNLIKKNKTKTHFLKYDFLLHQWTLRNMEI